MEELVQAVVGLRGRAYHRVGSDSGRGSGRRGSASRAVEEQPWHFADDLEVRRWSR